MISKGHDLWTGSAVIVARTTELAEQLLAAGELRCPRCTHGPLAAWGYGRRRTIRSHGHATITIRPRRTRCTACRSTHIAMPAEVQPRHADTTAVIGTALLHKANGLGYRRVAAAIDRPESTVRRWLLRLPNAHLERIYQDGVRRLLLVARETFSELRYDGNMLRHALTMLCAAAYWDRRRYSITDPPWTLIGMYTRGRLLAPPG